LSGESTDPLDLVLVGCGIRGTGLLTAVPQLLELRTAVVEASDALGPGSFADYRIESNSSGSDFFGWVDPNGVFGDVLGHPDVSGLRANDGNFRLSRLAAALRHFGAAIARQLPADRLFLRDRVVSVEVAGSHGEREGSVVTLASGKQLRTRLLVLATGIRERFHAELQPWRGKTVLSSRVVRGEEDARILREAPSPVVIVGGSHSGYSVAMRLHELLGDQSDVVVLHRSPVKLFYGSLAELQAQERCPLEVIPDPARDVCPASGNVFRYSGLRYGAKALFRSASLQGVPWLRQVQGSDLGAMAPWLDQAALVVQGMGYESNTLPLVRRGERIWSGDDRLVVQPSAQGDILSMDGRVFAMGMDPYPYRDNSLTPVGQYATRGKQILAALQ
jgi:hypothetical protein